MEKTLAIKIVWWRHGDKEVLPRHEEALKESGIDRAIAMMAGGYSEGSLSDNVRISEEDGDDGVEHVGWWSQEWK